MELCYAMNRHIVLAKNAQPKKPRAGEETTRGRPRYSWWRRRARGCQAPKCHRVSAPASNKYVEVFDRDYLSGASLSPESLPGLVLLFDQGERGPGRSPSAIPSARSGPVSEVNSGRDLERAGSAPPGALGVGRHRNRPQRGALRAPNVIGAARRLLLHGCGRPVGFDQVDGRNA